MKLHVIAIKKTLDPYLAKIEDQRAKFIPHPFWGKNKQTQISRTPSFADNIKNQKTHAPKIAQAK